jgi:hypothetical protein
MNKLLKNIRNGAILAGIAAAVALPCWDYFISDTVRTRITDAQLVKVDGSYMVSTEYRPFQNHDAWYKWKFNSGSVQNEAIRLNGKEVIIKRYGWRDPFFSQYENIVSIKEVK